MSFRCEWGRNYAMVSYLCVLPAFFHHQMSHNSQTRPEIPFGATLRLGQTAQEKPIISCVNLRRGKNHFNYIRRIQESNSTQSISEGEDAEGYGSNGPRGGIECILCLDSRILLNQCSYAITTRLRLKKVDAPSNTTPHTLFPTVRHPNSKYSQRRQQEGKRKKHRPHKHRPRAGTQGVKVCGHLGRTESNAGAVRCVRRRGKYPGAVCGGRWWSLETTSEGVWKLSPGWGI